jgi:hypothetical protein
MRRTVLLLKRCEGYRLGGECRIARRTHVISFSVKYYDGLAFKVLLYRPDTQSSVEKYMYRLVLEITFNKS